MKLIQDVMDGMDQPLSVQKHVVERVTRHRSASSDQSGFVGRFFARDEKKQIDAVVQQLSHEMTKIIFGAWGEIIGRPLADKRIQVDWSIDSEKGNVPFLEIDIVDGLSKYSLSERSLGFRWFFAFLLFTQFRKHRKNNRPVIFLFDEPASNLHSRAQSKLAANFFDIVGDKNYIIYSTHSHYMIDPLWLEKAYIIQNRGVDYDMEDEDSDVFRKTDIRATKYRKFVAENPSRTTYFQPVLDALQVKFSPLERTDRAIIIEGKYDYFPLLYFVGKVAASEGIGIFPGNGAGNVGPLISLFRGWGMTFRILLDDDKAGRDSKKRYVKDFLVRSDDIKTLAELLPSMAGLSFESLFQDDVKSRARAYFDKSDISKREYSLFFQNLLAEKAGVEFPETAALFEELSEWLDFSLKESG